MSTGAPVRESGRFSEDAEISPAPSNGDQSREFAFSNADFAALRSMIKQMTGINLTEAKRELVYGRVSRRLRVLGLDSFQAYRELLQAGGDEEVVHFCNALTTNLTSFFREAHHFQYLKKHLQTLVSRGQRRIRIWSAGCSTGEEAYSVAMTVAEAIPDLSRLDLKILATDLDSEVLEHARNGVYGSERVKGLEGRRLTAFFDDGDAAPGSSHRVKPYLANLVAFKQLNLMHPLPMRGPFDVILCRNVVIYFDVETQRDLFARIAALQNSDDLLFLGHSESLFKVSDAYSLLGKTVYRRI